MTSRLILSLFALGALAACGGGGSGTGSVTVDDFTFETSTGLLGGVDVPTSESLDTLPTEAVRVVNGFRAFNEANDPATTFPTGDATYDGSFAFGYDGDRDETVAGSIFMTVNFDDGSVDGSLNNITVYADDGTQLTTNAGLLTLTGSTPNNAFDATATGDIEMPNETLSVVAELDGAFGGTNADYGLGQIAGTATGTGNAAEAIEGYFTVEQQ